MCVREGERQRVRAGGGARAGEGRVGVGRGGSRERPGWGRGREREAPGRKRLCCARAPLHSRPPAAPRVWPAERGRRCWCRCPQPTEGIGRTSWNFPKRSIPLSCKLLFSVLGAFPPPSLALFPWKTCKLKDSLFHPLDPARALSKSDLRIVLLFNYTITALLLLLQTRVPFAPASPHPPPPTFLLLPRASPNPRVSPPHLLKVSDRCHSTGTFFFLSKIALPPFVHLRKPAQREVFQCSQQTLKPREHPNERSPEQIWARERNEWKIPSHPGRPELGLGRRL